MRRESSRSDLSRLERVILSLLEEAGEEGVSTLVNTISQTHESPEGAGVICRALFKLVSCGLVCLANVRNPKTLQWVEMPKEEALMLLKGASSNMHWSSNEKLWKWREERHRIEALLTEAGMIEGRKVLSEDGYPT